MKLFSQKKLVLLAMFGAVSTGFIRAEETVVADVQETAPFEEVVLQKLIVAQDVVAQQEEAVRSQEITRSGCEPFTLESDNFENRGWMPERLAYYGCNHSPALTWHNAPGCTETFVVIMEDLNTPVGEWSHWVIYNIPGCLDSLSEDLCKEIRLFDGIRQGVNDFGAVGYDGPAPASGKHTYFITIYALDTCLDFDCEILPSRQTLRYAMEGHILDQATLIGYYETCD